jgi:hypothetical protein
VPADRRGVGSVIDGVTCQDLTDHLGGVADGSQALSRREQRHVEGCLRCQADLVQYRRLLRTLRTLRTDVLEPSPGLLVDIFTSLEHAGERQAIRGVLHGRRAAYLGGIAAATAAGAAGAALVLAAKRRPKLAS